MDDLWIYVVIAFAMVGTFVAWRVARSASLQRERQRAIPDFDFRRQQLAESFIAAAQATGKPRGLRWKSVELNGAPLFAVDSTGRLYALIGATISFEAIEGGGMEDVEAVGNLRSATAVFVHRDGQWTTGGRVIFNLEPDEALARFDATLRELPRA